MIDGTFFNPVHIIKKDKSGVGYMNLTRLSSRLHLIRQCHIIRPTICFKV